MAEETVVEKTAQPAVAVSKAERGRKFFILKFRNDMPLFVRAMNKFNRQNKIKENWNGLNVWQAWSKFSKTKKRPNYLWLTAEVARLKRG